jgi:hypothetical protein
LGKLLRCRRTIDSRARRVRVREPSRGSGDSDARGDSDSKQRRRRSRRRGHGSRSRARVLARRPASTCPRSPGLWRRRLRVGRLSCGSGNGRGLLRRAWLRPADRPCREQRERVDVAVRFGGQANAEVDVRLSPLGVPARADRAHDLAFRDRGARSHADRSEMDERDRVAVGRANRQAQPFVRQLSDEGGDAGCGGLDVGTRGRRDVDSAVLAACIRVVLGGKRSQHRALDGPRPGSRGRAQREREQHSGRTGEQPVAQVDNHESRVAGGSAVVKLGYREPRYSRFRGIPLSRETTSAA